MKRTLLIAALVLTLPASAAPDVFKSYENVRLAFLANSHDEVRKTATVLATEAEAQKIDELAKRARAVAAAADLKAAREAFSLVSNELIAIRASSKEGKPPVYYCPMIKKSWLQAKGQVGNPYDPAMPRCGTLKEE